MPKAIPAIPALIGALFLTATARADNADRALLSTFCDAGSIKGSTCKRAKFYPDAPRRGCDVTLTPDRYRGRFVAGGNPLLVVNYDSGCEAHTTDNGGSVVFEEIGGKPVFRGFQPGMQVNECITPAKDGQQDLLVCLTGHMGQGLLESGVAQMVFRADAKGIGLSLDMLMTAEDSIGAYGSNVVTCKERSKYFELSRLAAGPRKETVSVEASYADAETIKTACGKGFPRPQEAIGDLAPGDAYVPEDHEKHGKFVIDLVTRKIAPQ